MTIRPLALAAMGLVLLVTPAWAQQATPGSDTESKMLYGAASLAVAHKWCVNYTVDLAAVGEALNKAGIRRDDQANRCGARTG